MKGAQPSPSTMSRSNPSPRKRRPGCPEEALFLELSRTTDMLTRGLVTLLKNEDLSSNQYNVLRRTAFPAVKSAAG
jgi:hypothetical protein